MKLRFKSGIFPITAATIGFLGTSDVVHAQTYTYNFVATFSELYPLSDYVGSFVELTAPTGVNVDDATAISAWNFVTPQGTMTPANSVQAGDYTLSWNASTITSIDGLGFYYFYNSLSPGDVYDVIPLFPNQLNVEYYLGNLTFETDQVGGYWEASPTNVAEPATTYLLIPSLLGIIIVCRLPDECPHLLHFYPIRSVS